MLIKGKELVLTSIMLAPVFICYNFNFQSKLCDCNKTSETQWQKFQAGIKSFGIESKLLNPSCVWGQITQDIKPIYG